MNLGSGLSSVGRYATLARLHSSQLSALSSAVRWRRRRTRRVVAVRLVARGVGALRGTLAGEGDFDRRRTGLGFGDLAGMVSTEESTSSGRDNFGWCGDGRSANTKAPKARSCRAPRVAHRRARTQTR